MQIDGYTVITEANAFASQMLFNSSKEPISIDFIKLIKSPTVLASNYGKSIVDNLILGAVSSYHNQLREKLLEAGINIGEMVFKEHF